MALMVFISFVPVIVLSIFTYSKDNVKEPKSLLFGLFISGFIAAVLVLLIDIILSAVIPDFYVLDNVQEVSFFKLFCSILLEIALVEEFCKWLMIKIIGYQSKDFDQIYDVIVYSVFVSLGFAFLENIFYAAGTSVSVTFYRAIFSIPAHACFGVFMGFFFGLAKIYEKNDKPLSNVYMFYAVLIPTLLHTVYNFCLLADSSWFIIVFLIFMFILYIVAFVLIEKISKSNKLVRDYN